MAIIRNGRAYPKALKKAVLKASKGIQSNSEVAEDFNISKGTVQTWRRKASIQQPVPAGLARHQAAQAALKAYNTPTLVGPKDRKGNVKPSTATKPSTIWPARNQFC